MKYKFEERNSLGSMGVQRRIVRSDGLKGPWSESCSITKAWNAYKAMRDKMPN